MFLKNVASLDTGRANKPSDQDGNIGSLPLRSMMAREGEEDVEGQSKERNKRSFKEFVETRSQVSLSLPDVWILRVHRMFGF